MQWKMRNGALAPQAVIDAIDYGCRSAGVPRGIVCAIAEIESNLNLKAKNASSGAVGVLQVLPGYLADYQRYAACKFDPASIGAAIAGGKIIATLAETGRTRGHTGSAAWQYAIAAHRYGGGSEEAKTPADSPRVLEVEAMMKANGMGYDTPQPAPATPVLIQLPMPQNPCARQSKLLATTGAKAAGFIIHSNGVQYVPAWNWPVRWNTADADKAVHFFADAHGIIQAMSDNMQAWHAGGTANRSYLGVELSEPFHDDPQNFAAAMNNVRWLVRTMQKKHGFSFANVIGHYEGYRRGIASNHGDPQSDPGYVYSADKAPWRNPAKNGQGYFPRNIYSMAALRASLDKNANNPPPAPPPARPTLYLKHPYMSGADVKLLQTRLLAHNVSPGPIDGSFGPLTDKAVRQFQMQEHLVVDGHVGPITWGALMA